MQRECTSFDKRLSALVTAQVTDTSHVQNQKALLEAAQSETTHARTLLDHEVNARRTLGKNLSASELASKTRIHRLQMELTDVKHSEQRTSAEKVRLAQQAKDAAQERDDAEASLDRLRKDVKQLRQDRDGLQSQNDEPYRRKDEVGSQLQEANSALAALAAHQNVLISDRISLVMMIVERWSRAPFQSDQVSAFLRPLILQTMQLPPSDPVVSRVEVTFFAPSLDQTMDTELAVWAAFCELNGAHWGQPDALCQRQLPERVLPMLNACVAKLNTHLMARPAPITYLLLMAALLTLSRTTGALDALQESRDVWNRFVWAQQNPLLVAYTEYVQDRMQGHSVRNWVAAAVANTPDAARNAVIQHAAAAMVQFSGVLCLCENYEKPDASIYVVVAGLTRQVVVGLDGIHLEIPRDVAHVPNFFSKWHLSHGLPPPPGVNQWLDRFPTFAD